MIACVHYKVETSYHGDRKTFTAHEEIMPEYQLSHPLPEAHETGRVRAQGGFSMQPLQYTSLSVSIQVDLPAHRADILSGEAAEVATAIVEDRLPGFTAGLIGIFASFQEAE